MIVRFYWKVLKLSVSGFVEKGMPTHASAVAYGMVFSFPPMLFVILSAAGRVNREAEMRDALFAEIAELVGDDGAQQLMATVQQLDASESSLWATTVAFSTLMFAASAVLVSAENAMNCIFEAHTSNVDAEGIWSWVRSRFVSSAMLFTLTAILLVSLVVEALISTAGDLVQRWTGDLTKYVLAFDYLLFDFAATSVLVALFFRYLPDVTLKWKIIWPGAVATAGLFTVGQYLIGFLIGKSEAATLYDAAGSVLVLMLWVFYASSIFLFGATFTFTRAQLLRRESTQIPLGSPS